MLKLFKEFKRRKVLTTMGVYGAAALVIINLATSVFPYLNLPDWTITFVIVLVVLGFPITFFLSWTYDLKRDADTDDKSGHEDVEPNKKSKNILLPLTGFLTIVGGAFWIWYSFGTVSSGSSLDLQMGIKKSIAVLNFENLTGQEDGDFDCAGIAEYIRSVLTKIGKLDVRDRRSSIDNNANDLDVDFSIQGTLSELGGKRNLSVSLVNAKSKTNLFNKQYPFNDEQNVALTETIIQNILTELKIVSDGNDITSKTHDFKNPETFKLIGEGIYHYEQKKYIDAIKAFESVLVFDPGNIVASYHKANSYFELDNFTEAMSIYKGILDQSTDINPIQLSMPVPYKKDMNPILCENIKFIEEIDLAIMLLKGDKSCRLIFINTVSGNIVREIPIDDRFDSDPVVINNTVFLASSRIKTEHPGEPTLYAYNILNGHEIFIKEFSRDNENQSVLFTILEEYNNKSNDNSSILLSFNKLGRVGENSKDLILIETTNGSTLWESKKIEAEWGFWPEVMLIKARNTELLLLILENDIIALNNKTGIEVWRENFSGSGIFSWNQKILIINQDEKYVSIWDPVIRKEVWRSHDERDNLYNPMAGIDEFKRRINKDVVLLNFTDGNLVAVNYDGGLFNWGRERWIQNIGLAEKIWFPENISNHVFCLTDDDTLLTINMDNGNISKRLAIDGHNYNVHYDNSQNAMVLNNSEFLIGVDPINGDQLWKIKDNGVEKVGLVGNSVLAAKTKLEDNLLLINNYNRDNGNLIWSENIDISASLGYLPAIGAMCGSPDCAFCGDFNLYLEQYSDTSMLLVMPDKIIKIGAIQGGDRAVLQKDVQLQIARTYEQNGDLERAIEEYTDLLTQDQMNKNAYFELASIHKKKNKPDDAAKSLISYYDLILPESSEGAITIQKLKDMNILRWKKNISIDRFDVANIVVDNEKVFLFIGNNIEAHSIHTSALIWQGLFGDKNTSVETANVLNEKHIFFIQKNVPDATMFYLRDVLSNRHIDFVAFEKASKYSLAAVNKRTGNISWDVPLEIPGESVIDWMGVFSNKIFIQSRLPNKMFISAYNITGGDWIWKTSRDISSVYTSYDLSPAFYNDILLLPLATSIEYINANNGIVEDRYSNEDIDHIYSFNQNSIQNNTMNLVIEDVIDYEYVVIDLDKNIILSNGLLDLENPGQGMWINNIFIDLSTSGSVSAYKFHPGKDNEADLVWQKNYNTSLELIGSDEQKIYLLDMEGEQILVLDIKSRKILQSKPLLWPGKNVEMTNHNFIVQSANKLFVVPR